MVNIDAFVAFNMADIDFSKLLDGLSYDTDPNVFRAHYADGTTDAFGGSGFTYDANEPLSGTVTTWEYGVVAPLTFYTSIHGLSIPIVDIIATSVTPDTTDDFLVMTEALSGDDTINGSPFSDFLFGGSGKDAINGDGGADRLFGNNGKDKLKGSSGADSLWGKKGNDKHWGGGGPDSFHFGSKLSAKKNVDKIKDFKPDVDQIGLLGFIFTKVGDKLSKKEFVIGKEADDKNDRIIYNKKNGDLVYDKNGSKNGGDTLFAELDKKLKLDHKDFFVEDISARMSVADPARQLPCTSDALVVAGHSSMNDAHSRESAFGATSRRHGGPEPRCQDGHAPEARSAATIGVPGSRVCGIRI